MEVFRAPHFPVAKTLEEEWFVGKLLTSALKTIPSVTCKQKKERMPLHTTLLTKVFVKSVGRI